MTAKLSPSDATALVDSYRVKLDLRPWAEFGNGRRSGRTTHTILCALARAAMFPEERVILSADPSFVNYCRDMLQRYAAQLRLDGSRVEVVPHDWQPSYTSQDRAIRWTFSRITTMLDTDSLNSACIAQDGGRP